MISKPSDIILHITPQSPTNNQLFEKKKKLLLSTYS
uniref:Uncharacterized protein n=1 Tax=Arundo donax TaxID=35708 RepID=A0A0A9BY53_ARUDO